MKTIAVRELQKKIKETISESQKDRVIITRNGKPAAILIGVDGQEWESVILETDPGFWRMIRQRRKEPALSYDELVSRLEKK